MCGGRFSILHYGTLIETYYLYARRRVGKAKQKQYPPPWIKDIIIGRFFPLQLGFNLDQRYCTCD